MVKTTNQIYSIHVMFNHYTSLIPMIYRIYRIHPHSHPHIPVISRLNIEIPWNTCGPASFARACFRLFANMLTCFRLAARPDSRFGGPKKSTHCFSGTAESGFQDFLTVASHCHNRFSKDPILTSLTEFPARSVFRIVPLAFLGIS